MRLNKTSLKAALDRVTETAVIEVAGAAFRVRIGTLMAHIDRAINNLMSGFFADLTARLGTTADLTEVGATPWVPLSLAWVKKKGHANFYAYSSDTNFRGNKLRKNYGPPLLPQLKAIANEKAFGKPRVSLVSALSSPQQRGARVREVIHDVSLEVSLYPKIGAQQIEHGKIEGLLGKSGALNARSVQKLRGKPGRERPVLTPMMRFYTRVKLPMMLRDLARRSSTFAYSAPGATATYRGTRP